METNLVKWRGILSTFVVAVLQTLFTLLIIIPLTMPNFEVAIETCKTVLIPYLDFFIPFLFIACCILIRNIDTTIMLYNGIPFKVARRNIEKVLIVAHVLSIVVGGFFIREGFVWEFIYTEVFSEGIIPFLILKLFLVIGAMIAIIGIINYLPNALGAYFLSKSFRFYKQQKQ